MVLECFRVSLIQAVTIMEVPAFWREHFVFKEFSYTGKEAIVTNGGFI